MFKAMDAQKKLSLSPPSESRPGVAGVTGEPGHAGQVGQVGQAAPAGQWTEGRTSSELSTLDTMEMEITATGCINEAPPIDTHHQAGGRTLQTYAAGHVELRSSLEKLFIQNVFHNGWGGHN